MVNTLAPKNEPNVPPISARRKTVKVRSTCTKMHQWITNLSIHLKNRYNKSEMHLMQN